MHFQPFFPILSTLFHSPITTSTEILTVSFSSRVLFNKVRSMNKENRNKGKSRDHLPGALGPAASHLSTINCRLSTLLPLLELFGTIWSRFFCKMARPNYFCFSHFNAPSRSTAAYFPQSTTTPSVPCSEFAACRAMPSNHRVSHRIQDWKYACRHGWT